MTDFGKKISKKDKSVFSTDLNDLIFHSEVQSLPLLQKISINLTTGDPCVNQTLTYTHNLGFFPFTLISTTSKNINSRVYLPFETYADSKGCGDRFHENFDYKIYENKVDIIYTAQGFIPQFGSCCEDPGLSYTMDIYFYLFELGS